MAGATTVLVSSRNRPLYLWACLDAIYRHTKAPHRIVLVDMASDDPLVAKVLAGFERRSMFDEVLSFRRNDPALLARFVHQSLSSWAPQFAYIESDVVVEAGIPCWLTEMTSLFEQNSHLAMLGATIDKQDFVALDAVEHLRGHTSEEKWRAFIKADSPERNLDLEDARGAPIFRPYNPPGRLLLLRTDAIAKVGLATDQVLDIRLREAGYQTGIATRVRHRHLSLTQVFDYPDYDMSARNEHMRHFS